MMARQIIREFLSVFLALLMAFQPVSTFALASCSQGSTLDEWTGLTKSLKQPEETGGNQDALDPMGSAPKIDEAKAVVPKPAASVVTPMDWQSISNILFQVQQAGASPGADLNRAYQTLVAKFGAREIYFVQELLTHYEHWNNAKFKQAKSITEIPGALAGVDASFVKVFGLSESESKKSLREVLIESFLKNPKRVARLARADGQLGSFFDASLPSLFDDQELKSVYERLNEFPEKDHLFPGWQELENLNRNIVLSLSQLKTKEELRKFLKAELKVENLIAVPFSKMNEVLETFVKAKQQQMLAAMPGNGAENGAKDESKELAALVNSADFQSDLFFGGRVSDQVAEMQATHDRKTPNFDAYEYRRKLNTDEWLKKADHVDYAGREKYRLIDAEKLGANLEIPSDLLVASSVSLPLSYQYGLTPDQMRAKFKNEQAAERFLESITSYTKYETREQKLKHLLAAKIISPKSDGDLRNDSAFLLTYSLNDLSALHFIRQTILNFPLEENQKNLDSKRLETAANRILKLQTRLEKVIGGLPELKFTSLAEFDRFEAKVFKVLDGISAAAPGIRVARYGFAGKKLEGRDELPTGAPKPLSISDFINMRGGEEVAFSSSRQTVFHNPEELLVQLEASQTTIAKKREKLAAELLKSWKEHFEKTVLSNVTERIPKQISELKKKLAETKEKPAQEALKTEITQLEQSIGDVEGFKKFAAQFSFSDWTLPQLEALQFLATRYGWEDIWFTKSPDPSGKKQWISTPIPIFSFVANFNPKDPIETANLLAGVQHVAAAEGIYLTIFGADWKKTLKLTKDGSRPSPLEVELQLPIVEKIIQELVKYQGFASQFSSGLSTQGGFPIPAVQWTDKKRQELVRFLDNPDSVVVDPKDPKTQQAFAERIRVPIQEAHLQTLFNQAAEIVWQKSDLEIRGEKVVAADRLKPLVHAQLLELGTILAPEIERRDQELRAMNRSLMQKWPSDAEQLSQKIAVAVTKDGMDYENFLKLLSGLIEAVHKSKSGPIELSNDVKDLKARLMKVLSSEVHQDSDFQNLIRLIMGSLERLVSNTRLQLALTSEHLATDIFSRLKAKGQLGEVNHRSPEAIKELKKQRSDDLRIYKATLPEEIQRSAETIPLNNIVPQDKISEPEAVYLQRQMAKLRVKLAKAFDAALIDRDLMLVRLFGDEHSFATEQLRDWFTPNRIESFGKTQFLSSSHSKETEMQGFTFAALSFLGFSVTEDVARLLNEKPPRGDFKYKIFRQSLEENGQKFFTLGRDLLQQANSGQPDQMNQAIVLKLLQKMSEDAGFREKLLKLPLLSYDSEGVRDIQELLKEVGEFEFFQRANKKKLVKQLIVLRNFLLASHALYETTSQLASLNVPRILDDLVYGGVMDALSDPKDGQALRAEIIRDRIQGLKIFFGTSFSKQETEDLAQRIIANPGFDFDGFLSAIRKRLESKLPSDRGITDPREREAFNRKVETYRGEIEGILDLLPPALRSEKFFENLFNKLKNPYAAASVLENWKSESADDGEIMGDVHDRVWNQAFGSVTRAVREREFYKLVGKPDEANPQTAQALGMILAAKISEKPRWFDNVDGIDNPFVYYRHSDRMKSVMLGSQKLNEFIWMKPEGAVQKGKTSELREEIILSELFDHQSKSALFSDAMVAAESGQQSYAEPLFRAAYSMQKLAGELEESFLRQESHLSREAAAEMVRTSFARMMLNVDLRKTLEAERKGQPFKSMEEVQAFQESVQKHPKYQKISLLRQKEAFDEKTAEVALKELGVKSPGDLAKSAVVRKQLEVIRDLVGLSEEAVQATQGVSARLSPRAKLAMQVAGAASAIPEAFEAMRLYKFSPEVVFKKMNSLMEKEAKFTAMETQMKFEDAWAREHFWMAVAAGGWKSLKGIVSGAADDAAGFLYNVGEAGYFGALGLRTLATGNDANLEYQVKAAGAWDLEEEFPWWDMRRHSFFTRDSLDHQWRKRLSFAYSGAVFAFAGMSGEVKGLSEAAQVSRMGIVERNIRSAVTRLGETRGYRAVGDLRLPGLIWRKGNRLSSVTVNKALTTGINLFGEPAPAAAMSIQGAMGEAQAAIRPALSVSSPLLKSTGFSFKNIPKQLLPKLKQMNLPAQKLILESVALVVPSLGVEYLYTPEALGENLPEFGNKLGQNISQTMVFLVALGMLHRSIGGAGMKAKNPFLNRTLAGSNAYLSKAIMHHIGKNFVLASVNYGDLFLQGRAKNHTQTGRKDKFSEDLEIDQQIKQDRQTIANFYSQLLNMGFIVGSAKINTLSQDSMIRKLVGKYYANQGITKEQMEHLDMENFSKAMESQIAFSIARGMDPAEFQKIKEAILKPDENGRSLLIKSFEKITSRKATDVEAAELTKLTEEILEQGIGTGELLRARLMSGLSTPAAERLSQLQQFLEKLSAAPDPSQGQGAGEPKQLAASDPGEPVDLSGLPATLSQAVPAVVDSGAPETRRDKILRAYREAGLPEEFFFITRDGQFEREALKRRLARQKALGKSEMPLSLEDFDALLLDLAFDTTGEGLGLDPADRGVTYEGEISTNNALAVKSILRDRSGRLMGVETSNLRDLERQPVRLDLIKLGMRFEFNRSGPRALREFVHSDGGISFLAKDGSLIEISGEKSLHRIQIRDSEGKIKDFRSLDEARGELRKLGFDVADFSAMSNLEVANPRDIGVPVTFERRWEMTYDLAKGVRVTGTVIVRKYGERISETIYPDGSGKLHIFVGDGALRKAIHIPLPKLNKGRSIEILPIEAGNYEVTLTDQNRLPPVVTVINVPTGKFQVFTDGDRKEPWFPEDLPLEMLVNISGPEGVSPQTYGGVGVMFSEWWAGNFAASGKGPFGAQPAQQTQVKITANEVLEALEALEIPADEFLTLNSNADREALVREKFKELTKTMSPEKFNDLNPAINPSTGSEQKFREITERFRAIISARTILFNALGVRK